MTKNLIIYYSRKGENYVNGKIIDLKLPLEGQATTTMENCLEKWIQSQVDIFGDDMKDFYKSGPEESRHINRWLASNCFGDYYTRELITFCFLYAQGGCEPQLTSHAAANMRLVMDFLKCLIRQMDLPLVIRLRWQQRLLRA